MSLEVAVRNPERYLDLIRILNRYDGDILNDKTILDIFADFYIEGALSDRDLDVSDWSTEEVKKFIKERKKHNNEWGFPTGYQAAFVRYLRTLSEFGFIYSQYNQTLKISEIGKSLCDGEITLSDAFAIQSVRFWRKSPYKRVLNDFNFFTFIYKVLIKLNEKGRKLSYTQFMVSLFSDDGNVEDFINIISNNAFGTDFDKAHKYVVKNYGDSNPLHDKVNKQTTSFNDYGNTVFRFLQLTGFITVDFSGIPLLSINTNRLDFLKDLMSMNFQISEEAKEEEYKYFSEIGTFGSEIKKILKKYEEKEDYSTVDYNEKIKNIVENYKLSKDELTSYLLDVCADKSDNRAFWFIQAPIKFEFLLTLFVYVCYGNEFIYKPNYKCDDVGIPYSHAPGNIGDIEIFNKNTYWLLEATLIRNRTQQQNNETINLIRHIDRSSNRTKYLELVAPIIHEDTSTMLQTASLVYLANNSGERLYTNAVNIHEFIKDTLEKKNLERLEEHWNVTAASISSALKDIT